MDAIGGGVLVAVAAALWVAYLLPTWFRRGQYLATERNAVRLQQTLRILAETAETPAEVRVEATAREVAAQQRILAERTERARLEAEAEAQLAIAERVAAEQKAAAARAAAERAAAERAAAERAASAASKASGASGAYGVEADASAARRALRRRRAACSLVLLGSLVVAVAGLIGLAFGWAPVVAAAGGAGAVLAFGALVVLARRRVPVTSVAVEAPRMEAAPFVPIDLPEPVAEPATGWTPQPLPKPLHLSRGTIAAAAMASVEAAERLRRAGVEAELAERAAKLEPEVPKLAPRRTAEPAPAARATGNPYAGMGLVAEAEPGFESLDAVLQRRRHAG